MTHTITDKQVYGEYNALLASDSKDQKKLWLISTVSEHGDWNTYKVQHNGFTIYRANSLTDAIKAYNEI